MIVGIGVDVVDLARFARALERTPALTSRLFAESELLSGGRRLHVRSLAGRFAAKEALIKALGESPGFSWHDMRVESDEHGNPSMAVTGVAADVVRARNASAIHVSMSHDAGVAIAYVVIES